ncbi:MAG: PKD-like family lipoprotein [Marinifilaceae bacterium]
MKRKIILYALSIMGLQSCYEDLGNYDYTPINELQVEGIESSYDRDFDEELVIQPKIIGTEYSDTTAFTYEWEAGNKIIGTHHNLNVNVELTPAMYICRYIVTDKKTNVKKYTEFALNVSSSTAGDLIMVLSKYKGNAELSYKRLDKPANFIVNYYADRFGSPLAKEPKQLHIQYTEAAKCFPFVTKYGRVMVLADGHINLIEKESLRPDSIISQLTGEHYIANASYPIPDIEGYRSEYMMEGIDIWRKSAYGDSYQHATAFVEISGGTLYTARLAPSVWSPSYSYKSKSPYKDGYITNFCYFEEMNPTPNNNLIQLGYSIGDIVMFDRINGRFLTGSSYGGTKAISEENVKAFPKFDMIYGSATAIPNTTSVAAITNGAESKLLLFNHSGNNNTIKLVAEVTSSGVINETTKFYMMKYNEYLFFVTDNKLYRYNLLNMNIGVAPSSRDLVATLTDFGYDNSAQIKDICVSRSERTLLLAISRYGADTQAMSDELKGDILYFDLNKTTLEINHVQEKSQKGISGLPVDIEIKYQTHWRDGLYIDGTMRDNI